MSNIVKVVKAAVGSYTDKTGKMKFRYVRIGTVIKTNSGDLLSIDVLPHNWDGRAFLNDPLPETNYQGLPKENDDDIPF